MIILIFIIRAKDFFHQSFHEIIGTSGKPDMIIVPANLTGSAILIRKRNNPCFFVHGRNRCYRKHMFQNHLFFQLIQFKILFCIMESRMRMRHSMNRISRFFSVSSPVIQKQIMKHTGSCCRAGIQTKKLTNTIIKICHIQTMLIATGLTVVRILLHFQHIGMVNQVFDILIKLFISRINGSLTFLFNLIDASPDFYSLKKVLPAGNTFKTVLILYHPIILVKTYTNAFTFS